jgi:hypothetical protein
MSPALPVPWALFAALQRHADSAILNSLAWGVDEALDTLLYEIDNGTTCSDSKEAQRRFKNLCSNRAAKYRRRQQILYEEYHPLVDDMSGPYQTAARAEVLALISAHVTADERCLLRAWAKGYTYQELAAYTGLTISSLKSKISRLIARLTHFGVAYR